jgi:hypothetical protein
LRNFGLKVGMVGTVRFEARISEEKRETVSDIDIAVADSLKVLDLARHRNMSRRASTATCVAQGQSCTEF